MTTRTIQQNTITYNHHHFFICVLKRWKNVGLAGPPAPDASAVILHESRQQHWPGPAHFVVFPVGLKCWSDVDLHMRYAEYASSVRCYVYQIGIDVHSLIIRHYSLDHHLWHIEVGISQVELFYFVRSSMNPTIHSNRTVGQWTGCERDKQNNSCIQIQ